MNKLLDIIMVRDFLDIERPGSELCWKKFWSSGTIMLTSILILLAPSSNQGSVDVISHKNCFFMSPPIMKQNNREHLSISLPRFVAKHAAKRKNVGREPFSLSGPFAYSASISNRASANSRETDTSHSSSMFANLADDTEDIAEFNKENTYSWLLEKTKGRTAQFDLIFKRSSNRIEYQRRYLELRAKVKL